MTLVEGDDAVCAITNVYSAAEPEDPALTLIKVVEGGPTLPTEWTLTATNGEL